MTEQSTTRSSSRSSQSLSVDVRDDGVAVVTFDVPGESQNTLREEFSSEFADVLGRIAQDDVVGAVIISGKPDTFIAGADINMIQGVETAEDASSLARTGQRGMAQLESLDKPVVAAVHGACLGGGFELTLACTDRVCTESSKTQFGLPEVQLGLLPGAGGTQRLPRLVGLQQALDMLLTGRKVYPKKAKRLGIVSDVVRESILLDTAVERVLELAEGEDEPVSGFDRVRESIEEIASADGAQRLLLEQNPLGRGVVFQQARKRLMKKTFGNYPAPERILDVVQTGLEDGFQAGLDAEAEAFGELVVSDEASQLMNIFFAQQSLKKDPGVDVDDESEAPEPREIERVGILGAGLMGAGIAYVTTEKADTDVRMKDISDEGVASGLASIRKIYDKRVRKGATSKQAAARHMMRITGTTDYTGFEACEIVVEAVFEDVDLKHRMIADIEELGGDIIFASNTSSIPITRLAEAAEHPERVIGMHYFSPVEKMPLLEIIVTDETADDVTATCVELGKQQGKTVIVVRDGVGFYTSRILAPYMNEAARILSEGVPIENIDRALKQWGYPVGPVTLLDEVGIDVAAKVGPIMIEAFGDRMEPPGTMEKLLDDDRKGRKNERGFYIYEDGEKKGVDESIYDVLGIEPETSMDPTRLAERCALLMVNEAVYCLQEDILRSPRDGDIGAIFGLGFPPFRGGPFRWIDALGADAVVDKMERYRSELGDRYTPAPLLVEKAESGESFH